MNNYFIEVCAGSLYDVKVAHSCKVNRIELNSALPLGGLTPSYGLVKKALEYTNIPICVMLRPRGGGFCYDEDTFNTMLEDLKILLQLPIEGVVFGVLTPNKKIDSIRCELIVKMCHQYNKKAIFHRAIDVANEPLCTCIEKCISLNFDRVLTSGQKATAIENVELLNFLANQYGDKIQIVVGSGINDKNLHLFDKKLQIHGSFNEKDIDETSMNNGVDFTTNVTKTCQAIIEKLQ